MKIFTPNEKRFLNNGLGFIMPIKCVENKLKSLNGWYIEAQVAIEYVDFIQQDYIAYVDTKEKGPQPFRIKDVQKENRIISFTANHVIFDSERYLLDDVRPTNLNAVSYLNYLNDRTDTKSPFTVNSNIDSSATNYFVRKSLLEALATAEGVFNGVYDIDGFNISLLDHVGNDNGVSMKYGQKIKGVSVVENWSTVCTKLLPEGPDGILLPEKYLYAEIQYDTPYTRTVKFDINQKKEDGSTKTVNEMQIELRELGRQYLNENQYPKINYQITSDPDEKVCIGDIINIQHPLVTIKAEVQSYTYDTISRRMKTLEFGNYQRNVKKAFDDIKDKVEKSVEATSFNKWLIEKQTDIINSQHKNGFVFIDENEIYILDKLPKEEAKNCIRFNLGGIGFSSNGIQGPFYSAWTIDGKFNADFIMAGSIKSIQLIGNTISNGMNFHVDSLGNMQCLNAKVSGNITGSKIFGSDFISRDTIDKNSVEIKDGHIYIFDLESSKVSVDIGGNLIRFYDWLDRGNYAGSIGSVRTDGRTGVAFYCDQGDQLYLGVQRSDGKVDAVIAIDANTFGNHTPFIRNTVSGALKICGGTVDVENGLIKNWDLPGTVSGYFYAKDGSKVTVKNGIITNIGG